MHINSNYELEQPSVCVCVLDTKPNILHSHIPGGRGGALRYRGGGGGGRTFVTYFAEEGVFF